MVGLRDVAKLTAVLETPVVLLLVTVSPHDPRHLSVMRSLSPRSRLMLQGGSAMSIKRRRRVKQAGTAKHRWPEDAQKLRKEGNSPGNPARGPYPSGPSNRSSHADRGAASPPTMAKSRAAT